MEDGYKLKSMAEKIRLELARDIKNITDSLYEEIAVFISNTMENNMTTTTTGTTMIPAGLPEPNIEHSEWLDGISKMTDPFSMQHFREMTTSNKRLFVIEGARRVSLGMKSKLLSVDLLTVGGDRVSHYKMSDEAKAFWENGKSQNMTVEEILSGWDAMQSLIEETVTEKE